MNIFLLLYNIPTSYQYLSYRFFLFCIIVSNVGKKKNHTKKQLQKKPTEFFEAYRVLWGLEFVETDLEDQHLQIKIFYIYKVRPSGFILSGLFSSSVRIPVLSAVAVPLSVAQPKFCCHVLSVPSRHSQCSGLSQKIGQRCRKKE